MTPNSVRLYSPGAFGQIGYGVPYFPKDRMYTANGAIKNLVDTFGNLIFSLMHMADVNSTAPPKLRWLITLHKAILRFRSIVAGEQVLQNEVDKRTANSNPDLEPFLMFPCPYFRLRNRWAKKWVKLAFTAITEAMKHQDNMHSLSMHQDFVTVVSQYPEMIYAQLAIEFFRKDRTTVAAPGFVLTDADFTAYSEETLFSLTERTDSNAPLSWMLADEDLSSIAAGVPTPVIWPLLKPWPLEYVEYASQQDTQQSTTATADAAPKATADALPDQKTTATAPPTTAQPATLTGQV